MNAVVACLEFPEYPGQQYLLNNLRWFKQPRAKELLRSYLRDPRPAWRIVAARALDGSNDPLVLDVLLAHLEDPQSENRSSAFYSLEYYRNDPRVLPVIEKYLQDPDPMMRSAASDAKRTIMDRMERERSSSGSGGR